MSLQQQFWSLMVIILLPAQLTISADISNIGPQGHVWQIGTTSVTLQRLSFRDPIKYPPIEEVEYFAECKKILT